MLFGTAEHEQKEWDHYPFALYCNELIYFLDGESDIFFQGKQFHVQKDSMLFLPKGIENANYHVHRLTCGQCIDIYFDAVAPLSGEAIHLENSGMELRSRFIKLFHTWSAKARTYYTQTMAVFYEIISLCNMNVFYMPSSTCAQLQAAIQYLTQHYLEPHFDYPMLAQTSGWSYSYFKKLFTAAYGLPPKKYVTQLRMNYARELLVTQLYSVTEVAEQCGYLDAYYFSAVFKRVFGVSPSAYKIK